MKSINKNEAPQPHGRGSFSQASSGAESLRSETSSLTRGLTPGVFAKGDKNESGLPRISALRLRGRRPRGEESSVRGQALLMLIFFVIVAMAVATSATFIVASNSNAATTLSQGIVTKEMADSGIEAGMLGILRDNGSYVGETINDLNGGTVTVTVTGGSSKKIDSVATNGSFVKKVEVLVSYSNNVLGVPTSWKEIY